MPECWMVLAETADVMNALRHAPQPISRIVTRASVSDGQVFFVDPDTVFYTDDQETHSFREVVEAEDA